MANIYTSAEQLIGNTPLLELTGLEKELNLKARLLAKLEFFNPAGSVKDRVAKAMLDDAAAQGKITKDTVIIEPTSGNTADKRRYAPSVCRLNSRERVKPRHGCGH